MQEASALDPGYEIDITEDAQTGKYVATLPAFGISWCGTFDEVSEQAMEYLASQYHIDTQVSESGTS